jgi:hypothetical protein
MEDLFIALFTTRNRFFAKTVRDAYLQFLSGSIEVANVTTGEFFNRADFFDEKGEPIGISESTTWSYLKKPANQQAIIKYRDSSFLFTSKAIPHNHRHKPDFSLSKVSFDDFNIPRKTAKGLGEVNCYYAYEPLSGCFIAWAHSREKKMPLIIECFRNMLAFLQKQNLPWPGEAEVERHLMTHFKDQLNQMFSHVRFCVHAREKRAEGGIRSKKYGTDKLLYTNIGRYSNKHEAYQINQDENKIYEFDDLVADDISSINMYNMQPHPDFPDKTRLQVLREMVNPQLGEPVMRIILKNIGYRTETSIRSFDYVRVNYKDFRIDGDKVLGLLKPNNYEVVAYWLPDVNGEIKEVYLYQDDVYLGEAKSIETYNEAFIERTDKDREILLEQQKHQAHVRKRVNDRAKEIPRVEVIRNKPDFSQVVPEILDVSPETPADSIRYNDIIADPEYWEELGKSNI